MQSIGTVWEDDLYLKIAEGVQVDLGSFPSLLGRGSCNIRFFFHGYHLTKVMLLSIYLLDTQSPRDRCCQSSSARILQHFRVTWPRNVFLNYPSASE